MVEVVIEWELRRRRREIREDFEKLTINNRRELSCLPTTQEENHSRRQNLYFQTTRREAFHRNN